MNAFQHGPFTFEPGRSLRVAGVQQREWNLFYGASLLGSAFVIEAGARADIIEALSEPRSTFIRQRARPAPELPRRKRHGGTRVELRESTDVTGAFGTVIASCVIYSPVEGMGSGLIDDRFPTWAVSDIGVVPMGADEFERMAEANREIERVDSAWHAEAIAAVPSRPNAWIEDLLPESVLTDVAGEWRAPTSWEIRHVVGEGSFTGITGARAAELVGVTPQNFRKYTAGDEASTRQSMSFAMWHLLLHKLGVRTA